MENQKAKNAETRMVLHTHTHTHTGVLENNEKKFECTGKWKKCRDSKCKIC